MQQPAVLARLSPPPGHTPTQKIKREGERGGRGGGCFNSWSSLKSQLTPPSMPNSHRSWIFIEKRVIALMNTEKSLSEENEYTDKNGLNCILKFELWALSLFDMYHA